MKKLFIQYINNLPKEKLVDELLKLYVRFDSVEKYYQLAFSGETEETIKNYKTKIDEAYYTEDGHPKEGIDKSKKIVLEFAEKSVFKKDLIDLWLYRSETMIGYARNFIIDDDFFYASLGFGFEQACKIITIENTLNFFDERLQKIVASTDGLWSGCYDQIGHIYDEYFYEE